MADHCCLVQPQKIHLHKPHRIGEGEQTRIGHQIGSGEMCRVSASSRQARTVRYLAVACACGRPSDVDRIFGGGATNAGLSADSRRWARWLCPLGALGTRFGHVTHLWEARFRGSCTVCPQPRRLRALLWQCALRKMGKRPQHSPGPLFRYKGVHNRAGLMELLTGREGP